MTTDNSLLQHIGELVEEEARLRRDTLSSPAHGPNHDRIRHIEEQLDQCWDLLRQRRARREFGDDPDDAELRPVSTVAHYEN